MKHWFKSLRHTYIHRAMWLVINCVVNLKREAESNYRVVKFECPQAYLDSMTYAKQLRFNKEICAVEATWFASLKRRGEVIHLDKAIHIILNHFGQGFQTASSSVLWIHPTLKNLNSSWGGSRLEVWTSIVQKWSLWGQRQRFLVNWSPPPPFKLWILKFLRLPLYSFINFASSSYIQGRLALMPYDGINHSGRW